MQAGKPSRTALAAAAHRAAHQVLEHGRVFSDPLALRILGKDAEEAVHEATENPSKQRMRAFIAARTRFAEDALSGAIERGLRQVVVLGAGLDTYAFRHNSGQGVRVFEVDHPDTQTWKRKRLEEESIEIPDSLTFAPVDFERETLAEGLAAAGFDFGRQTFFTWLGVVPYLSEQAVWSTLRLIVSLPEGTQVVFDYSDPPASLSLELRQGHARRAARVAEMGEAWLTYFEASELDSRLRALGFSEIEDLGPVQIACRYFPERRAIPPDRGGHVVRAAKV